MNGSGLQWIASDFVLKFLCFYIAKLLLVIFNSTELNQNQIISISCKPLILFEIIGEGVDDDLSLMAEHFNWNIFDKIESMSSMVVFWNIIVLVEN